MLIIMNIRMHLYTSVRYTHTHTHNRKIDATRASKPAPVEVAKPDITILIAVLYSIQVKVSDMFTPAR